MDYSLFQNVWGSILSIITYFNEEFSVEKAKWLLIIVYIFITIIFIIGIFLSYKGGKDLFLKGSIIKIILGFIFSGFLGLLIAFLAYMKQKRKSEIKYKKK